MSRKINNLLKDSYESVSVLVRIFCFTIDIIGSLLFLPKLLLKNTSKQFNKDTIKKIIIFRLDGIGDVVISSAALREIRHGLPDAEITLVVGPWSKTIMDCIPFYDHLIVHDCFLFSFFRGNRKLNIKKELAFLRRLQKEKFDLGIDLRGDLLSIIPLFFSGATHRVARATRGGCFLLTDIVDWKNKSIFHEKDKALAVVEALGLPVTRSDTQLVIPKKTNKYISKYLSNFCAGRSKPIVTVAPRALYHWRSWDKERFANACSIIQKKYAALIMLIGGPDDTEILEQVKQLSGGICINTAGTLSLAQAAALIKNSTLFIGNDSGLIHIAVALKVPAIQLFGPGTPEAFGYKDGNNIVLMKTDCPYNPCTQQNCRNKTQWCMDQITVEDVTKAVDKIFAKTVSYINNN